MIQRLLQIFSHNRKQRGATLLVTLGILTVISTIAVVFLTVSRIRQRTMVSKKNIQQLENQFDRSLQTVIHDLEKSLSTPNYADQGKPNCKRYVPVNHWFSTQYYNQNKAETAKIIPECNARILLSKTEAGKEKQSVQLFTPAVLELLPPSITNELMRTIDAKDFYEKFKSGWIYLDDPAPQLTQSSLQIRTQYHPTRISYAIINVSDQFDANYPLATSTSETLAKQIFHATDLTNWLEDARQNLDLNLETNLPFTAYSYDPDPEVVPINIRNLVPLDRLGYHTFDLPPPANLNDLSVHSLLPNINLMGPVSKFQINSITNFIPSRTGYTPLLNSTAWYNDADFKANWWDPVVSIVNQIRATRETGAPLPGATPLAWNIANFMDPDRIPQISTFSADPNTLKQLFPTRVNYATEALPMINKICLFNLFNEDGEEVTDLPGGRRVRDYLGYTPRPGTLSNHYAVAVEVWYPYAPLSPFQDDYNGNLNPACYIGIYTSQMNAATTVKAPWTSNLLRDWMNLHSRQTGETAYEILFSLWSDAYVSAQGPMIWTNPLWQALNSKSDLWFTNKMQSHPYWPSATNSNGSIDIDSSFLWNAFQTSTSYTTATNTSIYLPNGAQAPITNQTLFADNLLPVTITNTYMSWNSDQGFKRMVQFDPGKTMSPFPQVTWYDSNGLQKQEWSGFISNGVTNQFGKERLFSNLVMDSSNNFWIVSSVRNGNSWKQETVQLDSLLLDTNHVPVVSIPVDDLGVLTEITQPKPLPDSVNYPLLPMVNALIDTLPTNSTSELYSTLMKKPWDGNLQWDLIYKTISSVPDLMETLFPSRQIPSVAKFEDDDKYVLSNVGSSQGGQIQFHNGEAEDDDQFIGSYWTIYPKKFVTFKEIIKKKVPHGAPGETMVITNYMRIGDERDKKIRRVWVRPVVTIHPSDHFPVEEINNGLLSAIDGKDIIVDEALLQGNVNQETPFVFAWANTNSFMVKDPRNNANMNQWKHFLPKGPDTWEKFWNPTNGSEIAELPFIHYDRSFEKIGELGYIYASSPTRPRSFNGQMPRDTVTFSTRTGAALLDFFTTSTNAPNTPIHGRVQANTDSIPVLKYLFKQGETGWLTGMDNYGNYYKQAMREKSEQDSSWDIWPEVYTNALKLSKVNSGWHSFTEMFPNLNTINANQIFDAKSPWKDRNDLHPLHDYVEDSLRHLPELLSFRQSIYHIVLCVQSLSPSTSLERPEPLAERRVFITILRDTFTGRWMIAEWKWLD